MLYGAIFLYLFLNMFPEPTSKTVYAGFNTIFAICLSARSLFCIRDSLNRFALLSQKLPAGSSGVLRHRELDLIVFHNSFYFRPFCSCFSYQLAARCHFIHLKSVLLDTQTHLSYPDQCPAPEISLDILDEAPLDLSP
jgi:hypothetical protein